MFVGDYFVMDGLIKQNALKMGFGVQKNDPHFGHA